MDIVRAKEIFVQKMQSKNWSDRMAFLSYSQPDS